MSIRRYLIFALLLITGCVTVPVETFSEPDEVRSGVEQPNPVAEVCQDLDVGDSMAFAFSTTEVVMFSAAKPEGMSRPWAVKPTKLVSGRGQIDAESDPGSYCLKWEKAGDNQIEIRWGLEIRRAGSAEAE